MPTKEVQGMMDIINKLNESASKEPTAAQTLKNEKNKPTVNRLSVSKNAEGMLKILQKLDEATTKVTKDILQESRDDIELAAMNKKGNSVKIENFEIVLEKAHVVPGIKKTFYNIKEGNKTLYKQIALFETAMGIVKGLLFDNNSKVDRLLDLDCKYGSALTEAAEHRVRCKSITETNKLDIAMAKQSHAVSKMKDIKNQIKSAL
tara:strand:+ start:414 stop:1028 length:615 start_codon:yes stop_codon:yes gene_type:complete